MGPLGYKSLITSDFCMNILNIKGQTNSIETNDVKHPLENAWTACFNKTLRRAGIVFNNLTALCACCCSFYPFTSVKFFSKLRPTISSASNIYTSNSSFHDAGFMACCVSIPYFYNSHLR